MKNRTPADERSDAIIEFPPIDTIALPSALRTRTRANDFTGFLRFRHKKKIERNRTSYKIVRAIVTQMRTHKTSRLLGRPACTFGTADETKQTVREVFTFVIAIPRCTCVHAKRNYKTNYNRLLKT